MTADGGGPVHYQQQVLAPVPRPDFGTGFCAQSTPMRSRDRWCPFLLWLVWTRWAWDLWLYRLLRTAAPGWVMRRIGQCMDAFGRDGTRITQDLDFEVARSAAS